MLHYVILSIMLKGQTNKFLLILLAYITYIFAHQETPPHSLCAHYECLTIFINFSIGFEWVKNKINNHCNKDILIWCNQDNFLLSLCSCTAWLWVMRYSSFWLHFGYRISSQNSCFSFFPFHVSPSSHEEHKELE